MTETESGLVGTPSESTGPVQRSIASVTGQVIRAVDSQLPPGDIAELRRLTPSDPFSPAFFKLMASAVDPDRELPSGGNSRDEIERRWAVFMQAAAVMRKLNSRKVGLGSALASAGYSEIRFVRLLKARGSILFREIRTAAHYLASKAQMCDLVDIARLLMVTDAERAESVRRSIARGYYGQSDSPGKEN